MNKIGAVIIVVAVIIGCYLLLMAVMPVVVDITNTANVSMDTATANVDVYPSAQDFMVSIPWILWFVPLGIGLIVIIMILRKP